MQAHQDIVKRLTDVSAFARDLGSVTCYSVGKFATRFLLFAGMCLGFVALFLCGLCVIMLPFVTYYGFSWYITSPLLCCIVCTCNLYVIVGKYFPYVTHAPEGPVPFLRDLINSLFYFMPPATVGV